MLGMLSELRFFVGLFVVGAVAIAVVSMIAYWGNRLGQSDCHYDRDKQAAYDPIIAMWFQWFKKSMIAFVLTAPILIVLPNNRTMVLMAASEIGQRAIQTPEFEKLEEVAGKSVRLLEKYIDRELGEPENLEHGHGG